MGRTATASVITSVKDRKKRTWLRTKACYEDWGAIHQTLLEEAIPAKAMQNIFKILQEWKLNKNDDEEDDEDEEEFEELESLVTSPRCGMVDARAMQNTLILLLPLYYN